MKESISKIFNPEAPDKSIVAIIVLAASVLAKIWLGFFYRKVGKKIDSSIMCAASADSFSDVMSTGAVLITTLILIIWNINIDAYVGIAVSIFIFISGGRILNETKNSILGEAPDGEIVESIKQLVHEYPEALGVHDLMVHNYGPGNTIVSLHVEVDGSENIFTTHDVIDNIEKRMCEELNIQCTIHLDPIVTDDEKVNGYKNMTEKCVERVDTALKIHDFRVVEGATHTNLIFDVAVPFEIKSSDDEIKTKITSEIQKNNATFFTVITIDRC
jgi:cation diffusion facilitator family transporter